MFICMLLLMCVFSPCCTDCCDVPGRMFFFVFICLCTLLVVPPCCTGGAAAFFLNGGKQFEWHDKYRHACLYVSYPKLIR